MVAIRFASALGVVFVAVLFDSLGVHHLFAFAGSGRGVDRSFVVADQGNQRAKAAASPFQLTVMCSPQLEFTRPPRALIWSIAFSIWRTPSAPFSIGLTNSHPLREVFSVEYFPSRLLSIRLAAKVLGIRCGTVRSCVVGTGEGCFEFDSESDFVRIHRSVPCGSSCVLRRVFCVAMTHMSHAFRGTSSRFLHVFPVICMFSKRPPVPQHYATGASKHAPHNEANMQSKRDSAQTGAPRFEMPNHGGMR